MEKEMTKKYMLKMDLGVHEKANKIKSELTRAKKKSVTLNDAINEAIDAYYKALVHETTA